MKNDEVQVIDNRLQRGLPLNDGDARLLVDSWTEQHRLLLDVSVALGRPLDGDLGAKVTGLVAFVRHVARQPHRLPDGTPAENQLATQAQSLLDALSREPAVSQDPRRYLSRQDAAGKVWQVIDGGSSVAQFTGDNALPEAIGWFRRQYRDEVVWLYNPETGKFAPVSW